MDKEKNEKHLDELISRAINTEKPQFDAEKWKQKYPDEYQTLISRPSKKASTHQPNIWRITLRNPLTKLAAAAVIILAVSFFSTHQDPGKQKQSNIVESTKTPAEMMTTLALERAFRRGGIEAVENQCRETFKPIGPVPGSLSIEQILAEFNSTNSERTRL